LTTLHLRLSEKPYIDLKQVIVRFRGLVKRYELAPARRSYQDEIA
jgi:hypothetical protein